MGIAKGMNDNGAHRQILGVDCWCLSNALIEGELLTCLSQNPVDDYFTYRPERRRLLPVVALAVTPAVRARASPATSRAVRAIVVVGAGAALRNGVQL